MADGKLGRIAYVVADLKRIGPTNQTLNIIRYTGAMENCVVISLFDESKDTQIDDYLKLGIRVVCLHLSRKTVLFQGAGKLMAALQAEQADMVHSWGTFADIVAHRACRKLKMKHVITLRVYPVEDLTSRMNYAVGMMVAAVHLHTLKNCRHVVVCARSNKKKLEDAYHWTHLTAIQNGVDLTRFQRGDRATVRKEFGLTEEDVVFIATGSIIPRKRIAETAEAFVKSEPDAHRQLWFLGDGVQLDEMKKRYESENIRFWGKQSDVVRFLTAADVFVSSSESEGMPNAVLEAVACRLPVLLSDIPQHLEALEGLPGCGESYRLGDAEALASLMRSMDAEKVRSLSEKTGIIEDSNLNMINMGRKYREYYLRLK